MFYNFNIRKFVSGLIPSFFRGKVFMALINALITPLKELYDGFVTIRKTIQRQILASPFAGALETYLNAYFGLEGEITISDEVDDQAVYIAYKNEVADTVYLCQKREQGVYFSSASPKDIRGYFIVKVPQKLNTKEDRQKLITAINTYKLTGTKYNIKFY